MTTLLLITSLFLGSWVVILNIKVHVRDRKLTAAEDCVHWYVRQGGAWDDVTHDFVQSLKIALKGEA